MKQFFHDEISSCYKCNVRLWSLRKNSYNFPFHSLKILRARENERVSNINILLEFILSSNWKKVYIYIYNPRTLHRIKSPSRSSTILFSSFNGRTKRDRRFYITENFPSRNAALYIELSIDLRHWIHSRPRITSPRNNRHLGSNPHFNF